MATTQVTVNLTTVKGDSLYNDNFVTMTHDRLSFVGVTAKMQVRSATKVLLAELTPYLTVNEDGSLTIALDEHPLDIPVGTHDYDLQLTFPNEIRTEVHTWIKGKFTVLKEVSYD